MNTTWHGKAIHLGCTTNYEVKNSAIWRDGSGQPRALCHRDHMLRGIIDYGYPVVAWGYEGNGPRQLAASLLYYSMALSWSGCRDDLRFINLAKKYSAAFSKDVMTKWGDEWSISSAKIVKWIQEQEQKPKDQNE